jgi:hypothetical protein
MSHFSSHIFLFPFTFQENFIVVKSSISNQTTRWKETNFKINTVDRFNQHVYFHDFAEEILFKQGGISATFEFTDAGVDPHYYFTFRDNDTVRFFDLKIGKIILHLYGTQVGVLSFFLENHQNPDKEDILKINEFGRRLFPQYLSGDKNLAAACKNSFLANSIVLSKAAIPGEYLKSADLSCLIKGERLIAYEDFSYFDHFSEQEDGSHLEMHIKLPQHILRVLGDDVFSDVSGDKIFIKPIVDDRMFVMCNYCSAETVAALTRYDEKTKSYKYELADASAWVTLSQKECLSWGSGEKFIPEEKRERELLDFWYRYIFIDTSQPTSQSAKQISRLIQEHTYDRWVNYGTLYGVSRYSFVILTQSSYEFESILNKHFCNLYYYLVLLALVERSSVLNFSERVSMAADLGNPSTISQQTATKISVLYHDYIQFINKIYLREITAQEQGIEIYNLLMDKMKIKLEVEDLDNEISELHTYVSLWQDKERNKQSVLLNLLAVWFLPASFITSILGIGFISDQSSIVWFGQPTAEVGKSLLLIGCGAIISIFITIGLLNREKCSSIYRKLKSKANLEPTPKSRTGNLG